MQVSEADGDRFDAREPAVAAGRFPSPDPLFDGCPGLFVQSKGNLKALREAAPLVREESMGIIFTMGPGNNARARLREIARTHRELAGPLDHVLFDASRYSGNNRRSGASPLDADWVAAQREAGVRLSLTDSPYIAARDHAALVSTLNQARSFGDDVAAVLPLHLDWLKRDVADLIRPVNRVGVPVALVLEHRRDPLGVQAAVAGLVHFLAATDVKVALLRCDLSVIGAVAFGASMGAVGTSTGLRHIYPASAGGGFNPEPSIGALVPWSMATGHFRRSTRRLTLTPPINCAGTATADSVTARCSVRSFQTSRPFNITLRPTEDSDR